MVAEGGPGGYGAACPVHCNVSPKRTSPMQERLRDTKAPIAGHYRYKGKPVNLGVFGVVQPGAILPLTAKEIKGIVGDDRFEPVQIVEKPTDLPPMTDLPPIEAQPEPAPANKRQKVAAGK